MATFELYVTGDEIGSYGSISVSGASNGTKLTLRNTQPLGTAEQTFRIVITDAAPNATGFSTGQHVAIYAWPGTGPALYSGLTINTSSYNGRATSGEHTLLQGPNGTGVVIDLNGVTAGSLQIGPGINPTRYEPLTFGSLSATPPSFPCFVKGTLIETEIGPLPIETLRMGDKVGTADHGLQPIRWIGKRTVEGTGRMAPVEFEPGAIGNFRKLRVSPQHRMLTTSWANDLHFGNPQVLVAAKFMVNDTTIRQVPCLSVTYFHLMFDRHEIIFAEGVATESLHLGAVALSTLDPATLAELTSLFGDHAGMPAPVTARPCLTSREGQLVRSDPPNRTGVRSSAA